jgi:hypothetical protein
VINFGCEIGDTKYKQERTRVPGCEDFDRSKALAQTSGILPLIEIALLSLNVEARAAL